ncbi:MAG: YicC family protein [Planctomycetota bacterium]|nr:MAG: YicC family protein [Planctomycetota bacterium]
MASVHSMTGFGAASRETEEYRLDIELRTVNNRFLKFITKTSDDLTAHHNEIERAIRGHVGRGTVYCTVRYTSSTEPAHRINWNAVKSYYEECTGAIHEVPQADSVSVDTLLGLPGSVESRQKSMSPEQIGAVLEVLNEALFNLVTMRRTEGEQLRKGCIAKKREIENLLDEVRKLAPKVVEEYRVKLTDRINQLTAGSGVTYTNADFAREVALFADRSNIDEEIDRLSSHLAQFEKIFNDGGVIGRNLEFLVQEMFREANTMSSKTQNVELVQVILGVKSVVDKLREQVVNIE